MVQIVREAGRQEAHQTKPEVRRLTELCDIPPRRIQWRPHVLRGPRGGIRLRLQHYDAVESPGKARFLSRPASPTRPPRVCRQSRLGLARGRAASGRIRNTRDAAYSNELHAPAFQKSQEPGGISTGSSDYSRGDGICCHFFRDGISLLALITRALPLDAKSF